MGRKPGEGQADRLAVERDAPLEDVYHSAQEAAPVQIGEPGQGSGAASRPGVGRVRG